MSRYLRWLEVKPKDDIYADVGTTRWGNHDIYPIKKEDRTFGWSSYFLYWTTCCMGLSTFSIGSSYITVGLTAGETLGAVLIGALLTSVNGILCGKAGSEKYLGYTVSARASFGLVGVILPLFFQILSNVIFFGLQAVYGGQAIALILGSIFSGWQSMPNTLPLSAGTDTANLVGFFVYVIIYIPLVVWVNPNKLDKWMLPAFLLTLGTLFGLCGWAVARNGGTAGSLVAPKVQISSSDRGFRFVQCISAVCGTYSGASDRFSDWTRYSKTPRSYIFGTTVGLVFALFTSALLGVMTTSATYGIYGTLMWNPLTLLQYLQAHEYTATCRAGTFFAGVAITAHQLFVNFSQNNVCAGMDLAGVAPKYLTMLRGSLLIACVGIIAQPWRFLTQATVFLSVISSFGVMSAATTGILVSDYWIVRKRKWKIPDLYHGTPDSIYWYWAGINPRSCIVFILAIVPSLPGLVLSIMGQSSGGAVRVFQLTYVVGFVLSFSMYLTACYIWPPAGTGISELFDGTPGVETLDGHPVDDRSLEEGEVKKDITHETTTSTPVTKEKEAL
ncbi:hypothetical protein GQ53DRAFT_891637 [Thozetella sp. PMI_491]|nr:hypothetical protein GQ53DRAFT_891637 [Thozetella sp. PMI_491]